MIHDVLLTVSSTSLSQALLAVLSLATSSIFYIILHSHLRYGKLKKEANDVPVINLEGNDFEKASKVYTQSLRPLLIEGYQKFKHGVFQLWSPEGFLSIVSPDFVDELKSLPTDVLDFHAATQTRMVGQYQWITLGSHLLAHTILTDLTQNMAVLLPELAKEIDEALAAEVPDSKDWTPVCVFAVLLRVIARMSGVAFVGPELNRDEEWLQTTIGFTGDVFTAGSKLKQWRYPLRPLAARFFIPEIQRVWQQQQLARRKLVPIMQKRRALESTPDYEKPKDLMQWLMDNNDKQAKPVSFGRLAELQLLASFAAIHTTTLTCTHVLFDLVSHPEYAGPLRDEIVQASQEFGSIHDKKALSKMNKLDSFMKESQRLSPPGMLTFNRLVKKPITLSNGTLLKPGTSILMPAGPISLDDEVWPGASSFQGFRFADMRAARKEDAHRFQFATSGPQAMHFGHGRQSCPGRFFASYEIKAILAKLISRFDFKLPEGMNGRIENSQVGARIKPNEKAEVLFRRVV